MLRNAFRACKRDYKKLSLSHWQICMIIIQLHMWWCEQIKVNNNKRLAIEILSKHLMGYMVGRDKTSRVLVEFVWMSRPYIIC